METHWWIILGVLLVIAIPFKLKMYKKLLSKKDQQDDNFE